MSLWCLCNKSQQTQKPTVNWGKWDDKCFSVFSEIYHWQFYTTKVTALDIIQVVENAIQTEFFNQIDTIHSFLKHNL
eukprot:m.59883 g.59883  ORF g.59883 m.59883 type:complete len:77 (+) comp11279_c0_seq2:1939-2169(+)